MNKPNLIDLSTPIQRKWFDESLEIVVKHRDQLSDYNLDFVGKIKQSFDLVGYEFGLTRKQMEHLKQLAFDLRKEGFT